MVEYTPWGVRFTSQRVSGAFLRLIFGVILVLDCESVLKGPGGNLTKEMEYGNHKSVDKWYSSVWKKLVEDVVAEKVLVFRREEADQIPGLRVSPLGVVEEKTKQRVIHDLSFAVDGEAEGEAPVNQSTYFDEIPECEMASVMKEVLVRFLGLRQKYPEARILIQNMDICNAFRKIPIDPAGAPAFGYVLGEFLVIDLRLQFGWRGSPGWFGVVASAIEHAHRNTTRASAEMTPSGIRTTAHVKIAPEEGVPMVRFFVDDAISLEAVHEKNGERCLELTAALASTHHMMLGERGEEEEQVLAKRKMTDWHERQVVLGWVVDTNRGTLSLQEERVDEMRAMWKEWPSTRTHATVKEVLVLAGKLHHAAFVIRPGRYFVRRLLQLAGLHLNGMERAGGGDAWGRQRKKAQANKRLVLDSEFMADVGWWRWYLGEEGKEVGGEIAAPSFSFAKQIASRTLFSNASTKRIAGVCMERRWYWYWTLPQEVQARTIVYTKHGEGDSIDINLLELMGVVVLL